MKKYIALVAIIAISPLAIGQPAGKQSYKNELQRSIDKGLRFLEQSQSKDGYWLDPDHPAITALCLMAYHSNPKKTKTEPAWVKKAYAHILKQKQKNLEMINHVKCLFYLLMNYYFNVRIQCLYLNMDLKK